MAIKLEIPTALRPFAGKKASVEFEAATVGDALKQLTGTYADLKKHLYTEDGRIRSFREHLRQRRRHPLPAEGSDTHQGRRHHQHRAFDCRRARKLSQTQSQGAIVMAISIGAPPGAAATTLSKEEIQRYSRHLIMPEVGMEGQLKLKNTPKVLMIGAGGLGAPLGLYLAAAGVGRLGIVDFDVVDFTNLQRQDHVFHFRRWQVEK